MRVRVGKLAVAFGCAGFSVSVIMSVASGVSCWATVVRAMEAGLAFAALGCFFGLLAAR